MDKNGRSGYSNRSVDDFLDPAFHPMRYSNIEVPDYTSDIYIQSNQNVYYPDQFANSEARNTLPFVFNTSEDVVPAMVGMGGGNYMVYGTSPTEKNVNLPNIHFANKQNGNIGYNNEYSADYNLFAGGIKSMTPTFNTSAESSSGSTPHLIDNLVGHWASDQSGTYSPFGTCMPGTQTQQFPTVGQDRGHKKPRIVAEVRPMRPSYSDVLAKSAPNQPKIGKPAEKVKDVKDTRNGRPSKSSVGRSLSGNNNLNNRHNLSGDDPTRTGSNSSLKTAGVKKAMDPEPEQPLTKKWVSLDDVTADIWGTFENGTKEKNGASPKHSATKKVKDGWETIQLGNGKAPTSKVPPSKKSTPTASSKSQPGSKDRETTPGMKFEQTRNKTSEERRGPVPTQSKLSDSSKIGRRNSRGLQSERVKRSGRGRRREADPGWPGMLAQRADILVAYLLLAARWLVSLVVDVFALSTNLGLYMCNVFWSTSVNNFQEQYRHVVGWFGSLTLSQRLTSSRFWPFKTAEKASSSSDSDSDSDDGETDGVKRKKRLPGGLKHNLPMPSTGEEAMKRLLSCKGKDPYSILGVSQDCTDDDIKRYYKRQAFLVHPDKNNQPGAEEAFKILVHAFDIIGEPEHRKAYDRNVEISAQKAQEWSEVSELLAQLHKKMEYVANTIRCTNCGKRHKRTAMKRPLYAARMCAQCKICHSVREGDIWAETSMFGLIWKYFACMDGGVYDISDWAACQGNNLKNLKANTHQVQYRIVLGKQAQKNRSQQSNNNANEPDLEEFINNLYSKPETGYSPDAGGDGGARSRKHKRKK